MGERSKYLSKKKRVQEGTLYNKAYATAMEARKAADDEDRLNLKEIRAVQDKIKPVKAGLGKMVTKLVGKVFGKKSSSASPNNTDLSYQANQSPVVDLYQKATKQKTANMYTGGEVEVTKGADYIKDLID